MKTKKLLLSFLLSLISVVGFAANTVKNVTQVTEAVTITENWDYRIDNATPITTTGSIDIVNVDHAVVIFNNVKPSAATAYLKYIKINGAAARNNTNCQVKMYGSGCIILPYGTSTKMLTVYSGENFTGDECNDFDMRNTGGYMNTLTDEQLNNRIRSFKLKRGYMVTFSLLPEGRGYSRCFIADKADLEMNLPTLMAGRVSSYRVFQWNDASKKGIANATGSDICDKLNVSWCYSFGPGESRYPNTECVVHHIYEDWPSSSECGSKEYSTHLKTNNEPLNSADDHQQDLTTILNNWENLMRTGMRLCSPSSWDGSWSFMKTFLDAIDARGWRCDIVDLHCYWTSDRYSSSSNGIPWAWNTYKRPIWISEFVWGASWNSNGAFASGVTEHQNAEAMKSIISKLNSWGYVERYAYWNSERDPSKVYKSGTLTELGEWYASQKTGIGYNKSYEYVPVAPPLNAPSNLTVRFDKVNRRNSLTWKENNGELSKSMTVQRKIDGGAWTDIANIDLKETAATYTYIDEEGLDGYSYRIRVVDMNDAKKYTSEVTAAHSSIEPGDAITMQGVSYYLGGNMVYNGDFSFGSYGWTNGEGNEITYPDFKVNGIGGPDNGAYLQAYTHKGPTTAGALRKDFPVKANTKYYVSMYAKNMGGAYHSVALSNDGVTEASASDRVFKVPTTTSWTRQAGTFDTGDKEHVLIFMRWLDSKAQLDKIMLCQLFDNEADALADAVQQERNAADYLIAYNTKYPDINTELAARMAEITGNDKEALTAAQNLNKEAVKALENKEKLDKLAEEALGLVDFQLTGYEDLCTEAISAQGQNTMAGYAESLSTLQTKMNDYMKLEYTTEDYIQNPSFAASTGWTKSGTFTGGDQRTASQDGTQCWNAWWATPKTETRTLGIEQTITDLPMGFYQLECKAMTQHYCITDQHSYMKVGDKTVVSPVMTNDYYDLPDLNTSYRWEKLLTKPIYVGEGESLTIGFTSSKANAVGDKAWCAIADNDNTGDNREGWWCATDFKLKHLLFCERQAEANSWGVICLPYNIIPGDGVTLYEIAGLNYNTTLLCLQEVQEAEAGKPYIYYTTNSLVRFFSGGATVTSAVTGACNLTGRISGSYTAPRYSYVLIDGTWVYQTASKAADRPEMPNYSAYIRRYTTLPPILTDWTGVTMPIEGVPSGIEGINAEEAEGADREDAVYTLDGVKTSVNKSGLYIVNGKKQAVKK